MNNTELAILSLIAENPSHGYEIEQTIEARGYREWTEIAFSSIYYLLKKMETDGLIESETEPSEGRGPSRKVYSITKNGKKEWEQACMEMLETIAEPDRDSASFLLGLSVLPVLPKRKVLSALKENVEQLKTRAAYLSERMESQEEFIPSHIKVMFDYSQSVLDAKRKWVEDFMEKVKEGDVF